MRYLKGIAENIPRIAQRDESSHFKSTVWHVVLERDAGSSGPRSGMTGLSTDNNYKLSKNTKTALKALQSDRQEQKFGGNECLKEGNHTGETPHL